MAVDTSQLIADAQCVLACIPPGMLEAAQLASLSQATVVTSAAFVVSTNGVQILAVNPKRRLAVIQNTSGANAVFVGPSTVTTSGATMGLQLVQAVTIENSRLFFYSTSDLYAAAAGANVRVMEFLTP
jgi:hypothetical protein